MNSRKLKILFLGNSEFAIFKCRSELIKELQNYGHDIYVGYPKSSFGDGSLAISKGCNYIETEYERRTANLFSEFKIIKNYKAIMKKLCPDIVLTYTIKPNIYGSIAAAACRIPHLVTITGLGTAVENPGLLRFITIFLYRFALRKANIVFFQNEANKSFFLSKNVINGEYKTVQGSGVNLEKYKPFPYKNENQIRILFVGRLMKEKGLREFAYAAKIIKQSYSNVIFEAVGNCETEFENEWNEILSQNEIEYTKCTNDMESFYECCSAVILPSYCGEGMANVLLEAAACGRPILASDINGCKETCDDGVTGLLFKPRNKEACAKAIEKFLSLNFEQRKAMGLAGRKKVEQEFDRKTIVQEYINEIHKIIENIPHEYA